MRITIYTLVHLHGDDDKSVTLHPTLKEIYLKLCDFYGVTPTQLISEIVDIDALNHASKRSGVISAMQDQDDGYEIYEQGIDVRQYVKHQGR